ncbi:dynamin domain containing protein [Acanthamoeba castellanii str. Neff]|uniref:Dynamin domain containing protein n=1 Tax=Acanthamoeba castellanii (strain ATCC 30010 / Neff) TaxID=1257118 RepID=L8GW52_ACACF|nr:dynamin domain containing protein [Acanthamoeba castellanii str. Neff]ELR16321.1 dynamin domain containing protein [Acanthamoeba castellanii str. Neff]
MSSPDPNPLSLGLHFQLLKRAGSLISSLDELRNDLSEVAELSFPQIIVVGQESSGKSSVLERIAMLKFFPRSDKMCTRMPIKLQLKHMSPTDMTRFCEDHEEAYRDGVAFVRARMEYADRSTSSWSVFLPVEAVEKLVRDTMEQAVQARNATLAGTVPNLTLIDLPGTCEVARAGEPENIKESTESLVEKYLKQDHTLVLLVMSACDRMHNYRPLTVVKKHHKLGNTIGVLTKSDLAENSRYEHDKFYEFKRQLNGQSEDYIPLANGYVAVRNRDTQGTRGYSLEQAAIEEVEWFNRNLPGYVDKKLASSLVLVEKLVEMMCTYVESTWATQAKLAINARIDKLKRDLDGLGPDVSQFFSTHGVEFEAVFAALAKVAVQPVASLRSTQARGQSYPYHASEVKARCLNSAVKVLQEATFVAAAVKRLLDAAKQLRVTKLARFKCFFDTLEAVITSQFSARAQAAEEQLVRKAGVLFIIFDSNPELQQPSTGWDTDLQARVVALLTTIIHEEVKAQLIAEAAAVADKRMKWDVESRNLHNALASIASLQGGKS